MTMDEQVAILSARRRSLAPYATAFHFTGSDASCVALAEFVAPLKTMRTGITPGGGRLAVQLGWTMQLGAFGVEIYLKEDPPSPRLQIDAGDWLVRDTDGELWKYTARDFPRHFTTEHTE